MLMTSMKRIMLSVGVVAVCIAGPAAADWKPTKPIEFVATAGPGGGTDIIARTVQGIIVKYKFVDEPIVVVNKGGGSGAEGYTYGKSMAGDPYKVIFGTSNAWQQPMVSKVAFNYTDLTPIAAMAQDEFLLWVKEGSPFKTASDYLKAAKGGNLKMGGAQSKDTDEVLTRMLEKAAAHLMTDRVDQLFVGTETLVFDGETLKEAKHLADEFLTKLAAISLNTKSDQKTLYHAGLQIFNLKNSGGTQ